MVYGIILDSARDSVIIGYGHKRWKRVVKELNLPSETFEHLSLYQDKLLMQICECESMDVLRSNHELDPSIGLVDILHEGTPDTYLAFLGEDFFRYFIHLGYNKLFRVAGRSFREFLFSIDQLHDSNRYTFPSMRQPLFHVTDEDESGAILEYKWADRWILCLSEQFASILVEVRGLV